MHIRRNQFIWKADTGKTLFKIHLFETRNKTCDIETSLKALWGNLYCFPEGINDYDIRTNELPVPEPTAMLLFATGIVGIATLSRRRLTPKAL